MLENEIDISIGNIIHELKNRCDDHESLVRSALNEIERLLEMKKAP